MTSKRHEEVGLTDAQVLEMYYYMLLARKIDERQWLLNRAGKVPFVISCQGQEAAQVGAAFALEKGKDYLCPYYRDLGLVLVFGQSARDCMLSAFAKAEDPNSGGRSRCQVTSVAKMEYPDRLEPCDHAGTSCSRNRTGRQNAKERPRCLHLVRRRLQQPGDFHEGANFAGVHKLPVIFFCENNKYAISVPLKKQLGCESVADRAIGYGFPGVSVDGNDPIEVYRVTKEAVERARSGQGPTLIEAVMYRLVPHSSDDDDRTYRTREEVEEAKKKDPILVFGNYLKEVGLLDDAKEQELLSRVQKEVDEATDYAEQAPYPTPESTLTHVYGE